jgi:hypothetical protein
MSGSPIAHKAKAVRIVCVVGESRERPGAHDCQTRGSASFWIAAVASATRPAEKTLMGYRTSLRSRLA